ncbi:hypothetical protein PVIIG_05599 [Plasmodium vivax India VII]|uniref:VIR protein n=1 Tax=Plasmodium vivax India VII TaxID=1077284 RepID=A0A0J9S1X5_PLAVI|nr:hypothetical protein PVIIG_05599 [Plasmodium vivax India VII]
MSNNILDISKWKPDYPFKNTAWNTYNEFNNDVVNDENQSNLYVLCDKIIKESNGDLSVHTDICMKLMRNLGYFSLVPKVYQLKRERCNILFNWIYKLINEEKITRNVINKCFEVYDDEMKGKNNNIKCHYNRDIKINELINITLLHIFDNNTPKIIDALMNKDESINTTGRKYVCECVKIYKDMNDLYCINGRAKNNDNSITCLELENFKRSYTWYLYNKNNLSDIIPSLDNIDKDLLAKCPENERILQLVSDARETRVRHSGNSLSTTSDGQSNLLADGTTITPANFTPAGRLVNPKLRTTGIINNNFYGEEANEMLFDRNENNGFNSYNIGYEAV